MKFGSACDGGFGNAPTALSLNVVARASGT
jgi:hypothetical protein